MKDRIIEELNNCRDAEDFEILITEISESSSLSCEEKRDLANFVIDYFNKGYFIR